MLGLPRTVDLDEVARWELRWWVVRREQGLGAGAAAGDAIANLYAAFYGLPREAVAEAGRLRGMAAEARDRGAHADPDGPNGAGRAYWPEVARLLRASYRSLRRALNAPAGERSALLVATADDPPGGREQAAAASTSLTRSPSTNGPRPISTALANEMFAAAISHGRPNA